MAIDRPCLSRRDALAGLAMSSLAFSAWPQGLGKMAREPVVTLLAAWRSAGLFKIGLIGVEPDGWRVLSAVQVPTRPHGLCRTLAGDVLAISRRPGDWMMRWSPASGQCKWHWAEGERRFNGHVCQSTDGRWLWTTETDQTDGSGWLVQRDAQTLEPEWISPTGGEDPHAVWPLTQRVGSWTVGTLMVANGGVRLQMETGRTKRPQSAMTSSLVAMDPLTGQVMGQWRLDDPCLSIRHLAWDPVSRRLGIALQAEHLNPAQREQAPLLALWDGDRIWTGVVEPGLSGYAGDIDSLPEGGFAVGAIRSHSLVLYSPKGEILKRWPIAGACGMGHQAASRWVAGGHAVLWQMTGSSMPTSHHPAFARNSASLDWEWDNHLTVWNAGA